MATIFAKKSKRIIACMSLTIDHRCCIRMDQSKSSTIGASVQSLGKKNRFNFGFDKMLTKHSGPIDHFSLQHLVKKNVRSIIFTSGTMSPLQPFITSLGIPIQVQLQNGHIIDSSQVLVEIVSHGPDSIELLSNFSNRLDP